MEANPTSNHEVVGLISGLAQWVKDLAWLWCRPADTALIRSLAWDPLYAMGAAPEKIHKKKREREKQTGPQTLEDLTLALPLLLCDQGAAWFLSAIIFLPNKMG